MYRYIVRYSHKHELKVRIMFKSIHDKLLLLLG
nr:MAG TPA: hypothetical protein [Caudoviricetes sp.]